MLVNDKSPEYSTDVGAQEAERHYDPGTSTPQLDLKQAHSG